MTIDANEINTCHVGDVLICPGCQNTYVTEIANQSCFPDRFHEICFSTRTCFANQVPALFDVATVNVYLQTRLW